MKVALRMASWLLARAGFGCLAVALIAPGARAQFELGLQGDGFQPGGSAVGTTTAYEAASAVGASFVRISVFWADVAPSSGSSPSFHPDDPADPGYHWASLDVAVRSAADHHLRVILDFMDAPNWAQGPGPVKPYVSPGAWNPNPVAFGHFLHAVAERYSGRFPDPLQTGATLPMVTYWEPWNEPNIPGSFSAPDSVNAYRTLLGRAYDELKAVRRSNVVIFGGLAPVSPVPGSIPPLDFGADLLCLRQVTLSDYAPAPVCHQRAKFDVFAVHPYALAATPTKHAYKPGDVLVGDISEVAALVRAADRFHTVVPSEHHSLWVTEFHWYTNPPNPVIGDSPPIAARYVAYSVYEMWKSGVSLLIWETVLDRRGHDAASGSGLYTDSGTPKSTLAALAFPLVASVSQGRGTAWGRVPAGHPMRVLVERAVGRAWRMVATARTGSDGVFEAGFSARGNGIFRAQVVGGPTSLAYNSRPIPPRRTHLFNIF